MSSIVALSRLRFFYRQRMFGGRYYSDLSVRSPSQYRVKVKQE
jgi:hypothetical protein